MLMKHKPFWYGTEFSEYGKQYMFFRSEAAKAVEVSDFLEVT